MKRELIVTADGRTQRRDRNVVIEGPLPGGEGQFRISIDGHERVVDARAVRPGTWSILLDGKSFVVDLDQRRNGIAASVGASEALLQVEDSLHRRLADAAGKGRGQLARGEIIKAPIAGKVVKLLVAQGDQVEPGTPVIVLEAMKMENELVAERGGTVTKIHKQPGQAVDTGDALVELT